MKIECRSLGAGLALAGNWRLFCGEHIRFIYVSSTFYIRFET